MSGVNQIATLNHCSTWISFTREINWTLLIQLQPALSEAPPENEGVVDAWDSYDVSGSANWRTLLESGEVTGKVGDYRFHDFIRTRQVDS